LGYGFGMARSSSHDHAQSKNEDAEKAIAGDQEDDLPGIEAEGIAPTLRWQIGESGFFFGHTALALSKAKPVKQHHRPSLTCER
jgi:hypothetical protein